MPTTGVAHPLLHEAQKLKYTVWTKITLNVPKLQQLCISIATTIDNHFWGEAGMFGGEAFPLSLPFGWLISSHYNLV